MGVAEAYERLAFVYDTERLKPSGLACELVVAAQELDDAPDGLVDQFARTPYAVSFARDNTRFTLVTLHVLYGDTAADRVPELTAIARWLARWSASKDPWSENLLALGDFNIDRLGDPLYQAFISTGLQPPAGLNHIPRTIFDDPNAPPNSHHFYDQIAWFPQGRAKLSLPFLNAGTFDFTNNLIPADTETQLSWRISDHLPLWCEFATS
jgi:endonuclease/exonuclease/phosphatase family metal-dependent hydrolase